MIKPTEGRVVVSQNEQESTTESGLILTEKPKAVNEGFIVTTSSDSKLSVGDKVVFGTYGHTTVSDPADSESYLVMDESNILCVIS